MQDLSTAIESAFRLQTVKYVNVASAILFVYDYSLTLDMEVQYIWKSPLHIGEILYYISRYSPFFDLSTVLYYVVGPHVSFKMCSRVYAIASYSTYLGIGTAEAIMLLRTWALWGNSRPLLAILLFVFIGICIVDVLFLKLFLDSLEYGPPPLPTVAGCYPTRRSVVIFLDFVLLMLYELLTIILTLWIGIKRFRQSVSPLVKVLYRDGAFYFIYTFLISAGNIIVLVVGPPEYQDLLNTFQRVMHSILSTRTVLHVRSIAARESGMESSLMGVSDARFAPGRSTEHSETLFLDISRTSVPG